MDIYGFLQDAELPDGTIEEHAYCPDCAVKTLFGGDQEKYDAVDRGDDVSFLDVDDVAYTVIHEGTIEFEQFPLEFYPNGLFCFICGGEIYPANEDREDE